MKKRSLFKIFRQWYDGEISFDEMFNQSDVDISVNNNEECEKKKKIPIVHKVKTAELKLSRVSYGVLSTVFCVIICSVLISTVGFLPHFADKEAPTANEVYEHYVGLGRDETGAVNTVAGMILDYRAFDTLGESFVLFTATCAVLLLLDGYKTTKNRTKNTFAYTNDPIVGMAAKIIIPIIMVFGVYVLFNGHLSPGGGFSGGSILGAGLILYAQAYGNEKAIKVIPAGAIRAITIFSLSFYCLSKSYSFFTGNEFNGIHSVIGPGTPGDFLSGGLILPLNLAVGLVVCCTMYTFYMVFTRGRLD